MGYRTTRRGDGTVTIHGVEIFAECEHALGFEFSQEWVTEALSALEQKAAEGYYPPIHVLHHEAKHEATGSVIHAGYFEATGTEVVQLDGQPVLAIIADLHITNPDVVDRVAARQLPYRSVEILNAHKPFLDSLALLDHEPPALKFPMLAMDGYGSRFSDLPGELTFQRYDDAEDGATGMHVVASLSNGTASKVLFRAAPNMTKIQKNTPPAKKPAKRATTKPAHFAEGEGEGAEGEAGGGLNVDAVVSAIESGEISVADFAAIQAAMASMAPAEEPEDDDEEDEVQMMEGPDDEEEPKPAMMRQVARLHAELDALKAKEKQRAAADRRREDVANALVRLSGRVLGADAEAKFNAYHQKNGAASFADYVDHLAEALPLDMDTGAEAAARFAGQPHITSSVVSAYEDPADQQLAANFSAQWQELHRARATRVDEKRFVEINMAKAKGLARTR